MSNDQETIEPYNGSLLCGEEHGLIEGFGEFIQFDFAGEDLDLKRSLELARLASDTRIPSGAQGYVLDLQHLPATANERKFAIDRLKMLQRYVDIILL